MSKHPFNYRQAYLAVSQYADLNINKRTLKFSPGQKGKITKAVKALLHEGLIYFDEEKNKFSPAVKFVRMKHPEKREKIKGIKNTLNGQFIRGARPGQKTKGQTIYTANYTKIYIPMDFSGIEKYNDLSNMEKFAYEVISTEIAPYYSDIKKADYFTILVANGWEIGRGQLTRSSYPKKKIITKTKNKHGRYIKKRIIDRDALYDEKEAFIKKYAKGQAGRARKLHTLAREIAEICSRILNNNTKRYKLGLQTIAGIYLYKFLRQKSKNRK